ncbi:transglutaminase-like domain-containing protein [Pseudonocardia sp. GCM10023141]|uniref:transglutaminase-like domain-containing protein n=1 Tax=Pseudonocardia sp. GCM10023141 TaxID=3252653 RepID=UPI003621F75C
MDPAYTQPGTFVDSDAPEVLTFARKAVGSATDPVERAVRLFDAVRDRIWYDPFGITPDPAAYRASAVATSQANWCVPKAVLLTAAARAVGIPARLGFADVRNHFQTPRLRARMGGSDVFVYHGYSDLYLDGRWVKATPAFNAELCARFGVPPIAFDGRQDALLHAFAADGSAYMEYERDRGVHADLPLDEVLDALTSTYGQEMLVPSTGRATDAFSAPT